MSPWIQPCSLPRETFKSRGLVLLPDPQGFLKSFADVRHLGPPANTELRLTFAFHFQAHTDTHTHSHTPHTHSSRWERGGKGAAMRSTPDGPPRGGEVRGPFSVSELRESEQSLRPQHEPKPWHQGVPDCLGVRSERAHPDQPDRAGMSPTTDLQPLPGGEGHVGLESGALGAFDAESVRLRNLGTEREPEEVNRPSQSCGRTIAGRPLRSPDAGTVGNPPSLARISAWGAQSCSFPTGLI